MTTQRHCMLHAIICYCHVAKIQVRASQMLIYYCYDTYKQNPNKCIVQVLLYMQVIIIIKRYIHAAWCRMSRIRECQNFPNSYLLFAEVSMRLCRV